MLQNVTPKKLFEPKLDYDVINAKLIKEYDCHTTTAARHWDNDYRLFLFIRLLL